MFRRLDKFDGPIVGFVGGGGWRIYGGLIFGMLIRLHIWGAYIRRGAYIRGRIDGILRYVIFPFQELQNSAPLGLALCSGL